VPFAARPVNVTSESDKATDAGNEAKKKHDNRRAALHWRCILNLRAFSLPHSAQSPLSREKLSGPAAIDSRFSTNADGPAIRHNAPHERTSTPPPANPAAVLHACPALGDRGECHAPRCPPGGSDRRRRHGP